MVKRFLMLMFVMLLLLTSLGAPVWAARPAQEGDSPATLPPEDQIQTVAPASDVSAQWKSQVTNPGVYIFYDYLNFNPADYPGVFVGGHMTFAWRDIEKAKNVYDWSIVDNFIAAQAAYGKPVGIEVVAYVGASSYDPNVRGNVAPGWLPKVTCVDHASRVFEVPNFGSYTQFELEYQKLISALGARYNNDERVAFVEISTGVDGENQPVQYNQGNLLENCLMTTGLQQYQWEEYMKRVTNYYHTAFPNKPLMQQHYPTYVHDSERRTMGNYAGPLGVGFKGNGLVPDRDKATRRDDPANSFYIAYLDDPIISYSDTVPIGFETYGFYLWDPILQYWAILNGLDKRADYLAMDKDTFLGLAGETEAQKWDRQVSLRLANQYLGKSVTTTPDIWVAMRESGYTFYPQKGNYSFFLKQDDNIAGGRTKATTYRPAGTGAYEIQATTVVETSQAFLANTKEGWITRRTDQDSGNRYMWFKADDGYINGGTNAISITVTYFDRGSGTWSLEYDGPGGAYTPAGTVTKTNTNTWKNHTFFIDDARMANGLLGSSDFRIDCKNDDNEYIHMVKLAKRSGPPAYDISLRTGANLVSLPLEPSSTALADVLSSIAGKYSKVFAYDGTAKTWKSFDVTLPAWANTLENIDQRMGFWIYMNEAATLRVTGTMPTSTSITLKNGANLVSFPRSNAQALADALTSIAGQYSKVFEYDALSASWKSYDTSLPAWANTLQQLRPGYGYWIYVTSDCTLTVTN